MACKKKVISHLKSDIKNFNKEAKEDRELIKELKGKKMKKQGFNARMDESLSGKHGKKKQSMKSRRKESEGMEKAEGKRKYASVKSMDMPKKRAYGR